MPTSNYDLNLMFENSLQKELIINENFFTIDSLVVCKVIDFIDSLPSNNLQNGDTWIISENSIESLQHRRGNIVLYSGNNGFKFIEPKNGMVVFISSKKAIIAHENNHWVNFTLEQVDNNSDIGDTSSFAKLTDLAQYQKSTDSLKINDSTSSTSSVYSSKKIDDAMLQVAKTSDLESLAKLTDLSTLAKLTDLQGLLKSSDINLSEFLKKTDIDTSQFLKTSDLIPFAKLNDLTQLAKLTDLAQYQKSADSLKINDSISSTSSVYSSKKIDDAILLAISSLNIQQSSSDLSSAVSNFVGDYKQSAILENHAGWLLCNGSAILRSKYQNLFKLIGLSFGSGDGSTTFNLPDFRGKVFGCAGLGLGLSDRSIGSYVGEEKHLMTEAEMPKHRHVERLGTASLTMGTGDGQGNIAGTRITYTGGLTGVANMTDFAGYGNGFNVMQPTLFGGNIFIFSGVIS